MGGFDLSRQGLSTLQEMTSFACRTESDPFGCAFGCVRDWRMFSRFTVSFL